MSLFLLYPLMTVVFAAIHIAAVKEARTAEGSSRTLLIWAIFFNVGVAGFLGFYAHVFRSAETAAYIGWAAGGPFQFEVACANLAFGVLGVLCLFFGDMFRLATIVGQAVFSLGAAYGHLRDIQVTQNMAPGNAGAPLSMDIALPPILLVLWILSRVTHERARRARAQAPSCTPAAPPS